jgi:hypothetical protein
MIVFHRNLLSIAYIIPILWKIGEIIPLHNTAKWLRIYVALISALFSVDLTVWLGILSFLCGTWKNLLSRTLWRLFHHLWPTWLLITTCDWVVQSWENSFCPLQQDSPILLPGLILCSPGSMHLRPEPGRLAHFPASLWCVLLASFQLSSRQEPQLAAMCKGRGGGGSQSSPEPNVDSTTELENPHA